MTDRRMFTEGQILAMEEADKRKKARVIHWVKIEAVTVLLLGILWFAATTLAMPGHYMAPPVYGVDHTPETIAKVVAAIVAIGAHVWFYRWVHKTA